MCGSRKFCQALTTFFIFLVYEGREDPSTTLNGVSLACRWWPNIEFWLGSFVIFQGIWTNIAKKPYIFLWFFGGGGRIPSPPPHWIRAWSRRCLLFELRNCNCVHPMFREGRNFRGHSTNVAECEAKSQEITITNCSYWYLSRGMRFPTMWHFDMCRLRRACAASYAA